MTTVDSEEWFTPTLKLIMKTVLVALILAAIAGPYCRSNAITEARGIAVRFYRAELLTALSGDRSEWGMSAQQSYVAHVEASGPVSSYTIFDEGGAFWGLPAYQYVETKRKGIRYVETLRFYNGECLEFRAETWDDWFQAEGRFQQ